MATYNTYKALFPDDSFKLAIAKNMKDVVVQLEREVGQDIELIKVEEHDVLFNTTDDKIDFTTEHNEFGKIYPESGIVNLGEEVIFTAVPNENGEFVGFEYGNVITEENPIIVRIIPENLPIVAKFIEKEPVKIYHNIHTLYSHLLGNVYPEETTVLNDEHLDVYVVAKDNARIDDILIITGSIPTHITEFEDNKTYHVELVNINDSILIKPTFVEQCTVTIKNGNETTTEIVDIDTIYQLPNIPDTSTQHLTNWFVVEDNTYVTNEYQITKNITFIAQWVNKQSTIHYKSSDDRIELVETSTIVDTETDYTLPIPQDVILEDIGQFHFLGWYIDNPNELYTHYLITDDITFIAKWEIKEYVTVTFATDEQHSSLLPENIRIISGMTLELPTIDNEDFLGWYIGDNLVESPLTVTTDLTLFAKFRIEEYVTISFITHEEEYESELPESETVLNGSTYTTPIIDDPYFKYYKLNDQVIEASESIIINGNTKLVACFLVFVSITYFTNDTQHQFDLPMDADVPKNEPFTLPTITNPSGYLMYQGLKISGTIYPQENMEIEVIFN